jgi:ABC-type branched-subunit amino acid transport system ATPase component
VLDRGGVLAVGTPAQIQANDAVRNAYLGGMEVHPA